MLRALNRHVERVFDPQHEGDCHAHAMLTDAAKEIEAAERPTLAIGMAPREDRLVILIVATLR